MSSTDGKRVRSSKKNDRISDLPDDILVLILSRLRMPEAARTSVLSRRWRFLWVFTQALEFKRPLNDLEIDWCLQNFEYERLQEYHESENCRFVEWVNQVLKLHKAATIDFFNVDFYVGGERYKSHIDSWLKFAFAKKVKMLQLSLSHPSYDDISPNYTLTPPFLRGLKLDSLTVLYLNRVDVTAEVFGYFLSKCPRLKALSVTRAKSLVNLKVCGPSLRLEHLEISHCRNLKSLEIVSLNLGSFVFVGFRTVISFKDVPSLVKVYYVSNGGFTFDDGPRLPPFPSQLKYLFLEKLKRLPKFPTLRNLKLLDLTLNARGASDLLRLMSLLKACPALHELRLYIFSINEAVRRKIKAIKPSHVGLEGRHECLKVFKLGGFVGCKIDKELILNMVNYVVSLEKIVIVPCPHTTRACAMRLKSRIPPGVELVVQNPK